MTTYCTHADCRAKVAADLRYIAARLRRPAVLVLARALKGEVPCRRDDARPRSALPRGPANTHIPLPPKGDSFST